MSKEIKGTFTFENKCKFEMEKFVYATNPIEIKYAIDIPDQYNENKFKKELDALIQKELDAEQKIYNSLGDMIKKCSYKGRRGPTLAKSIQLEKISKSIELHHTGLPKKFQSMIENKCALLVKQSFDKQYLRQVKVKAAAKIVGHTTLALSQAASSLTAIALTGGIATPVVAPAAISSIKNIADGLVLAWKAFSPIAASLEVVNSKIFDIQDSGREIKSLLDLHLRKIAAEEARLKDLRITANRLKGETEQHGSLVGPQPPKQDKKAFQTHTKQTEQIGQALQSCKQQINQIDQALAVLGEQRDFIAKVSARLNLLDGFADGLQGGGTSGKFMGRAHQASKAANSVTPFLNVARAVVG